MFNFTANNLILVSKSRHQKCIVLTMKDRNTNRCYKIHDFSKTADFDHYIPYCISGKVNSADKIYLVLESFKEDKKNA